MCNMVAAAQHHPDAANLVGFNLPPHCQNLSIHPSGNGGDGSRGTGVPVPKIGSPAISSQNLNNGGAGGIQMPRLGSPAGSGNKEHTYHGQPSGHNTSSSNSSSSNSHPLAHLNSSSLSITRLGSPSSAHDLRMTSPDESPLASPIGMGSLEPAVNLAVGGSNVDIFGNSTKSRSYASSSPPRPEHLFQDQDIADLVATTTRSCPSRLNSFKETTRAIKVEPMTECRGD